MGAVRLGMACEEVTCRFWVGTSTVLRWARRLRETGSFAALPMGGKKPFVLADEQAWLLDRLAAKPGLTLRGLLAELHARGIVVSCFALWRVARRVGLSFKKRPCPMASAPGPG